ncbi:cortexin-1 isoform X2 [Hemicordylus capensis]|uniref:cortexin-1 isoform X2 n=1 Tax=Hemicordylus capensis TaxID=884348 RepID=UPI0023033A8C|nr:cortexin-1 isoform X2 [Hemicordylus capensis]
MSARSSSGVPGRKRWTCQPRSAGDGEATTPPPRQPAPAVPSSSSPPSAWAPRPLATLEPIRSAGWNSNPSACSAPAWLVPSGPSSAGSRRRRRRRWRRRRWGLREPAAAGRGSAQQLDGAESASHRPATAAAAPSAKSEAENLVSQSNCTCSQQSRSHMG